MIANPLVRALNAALLWARTKQRERGRGRERERERCAVAGGAYAEPGFANSLATAVFDPGLMKNVMPQKFFRPVTKVFQIPLILPVLVGSVCSVPAAGQPGVEFTEQRLEMAWVPHFVCSLAREPRTARASAEKSHCKRQPSSSRKHLERLLQLCLLLISMRNMHSWSFAGQRRPDTARPSRSTSTFEQASRASMRSLRMTTGVARVPAMVRL